MFHVKTPGRAALVTLSALSLALAACGDDDDSSGDESADAAEPEAETDGDAAEPEADAGESSGSSGGGNVYGGELEDGTSLTVTFGADETDPLVAPFVAFREQAGVTDDVVWITGSLDAPADFDDAMGPPTGRFLTFVEPGAELIAETNPTSTFACSELQEWFGTPTGDEGAALNDAYIAILGESCDGQTLGVVGEIGATTDYVMFVEGTSIPEFDAVYAGLLTELQPL